MKKNYTYVRLIIEPKESTKIESAIHKIFQLSDWKKLALKKQAGKAIRLASLLVCTLAFLGISGNVHAQTWDMGVGAAANGATIADCSGTFYDSGGSGSAYFNNDNLTLTFTPPNGQVVATFNSYIIQSSGATCVDVLSIYDGTSATAPLIGAYCDAIPPPAVITSTSGSLHFVFVSDGATRRQGWDVGISNTDASCGSGGGGTTCTYRDEFSAVSYSNSDGTESWATSWTESGDSNGATGTSSCNSSTNSIYVAVNGNCNYGALSQWK